LEQRDELVRLDLECVLEPVVAFLDLLAVELVAVGLTGLGQEDERCGVRGLRREDQVQENERTGVEVVEERDRVEGDPECDDDRLADDVSRCAEEAAVFSANRPKVSSPNAL